MLENVPEIQTWGPLDTSGKPIKSRAGETFDGFINALSCGIPKMHPAFAEMCAALEIGTNSEEADRLEAGLGYSVEFRVLKSCDYGAPTSRARFYLIARNDGAPIVWAKPTHAPRKSEAVKRGRMKPYRAVSECIDWGLPVQSIFERDKPLAENTLRRIARGIKRFVIDNPEPFIVNYKFDNDPESINEPLSTITAVANHYVVAPTITAIGQTGTPDRSRSVEEPLSTIVSKAEHLLIAPTLIQYHGETADDEVRGQMLDEPIMTLDTSNRYALAVANIMQNYGGGYKGAGRSLDEPLPTITATDHNALVTAHIMTLRNNMDGQTMDEPLSTISTSGAHHAEVCAFLIKYFSNGAAKSVAEPLDTITTKDRFALITVNGKEYVITDIGMRMLQPHELFKAQGFPDDYIIDRDADGKPYPKTKQVARCGNAVTPQVPTALVRANLPEYCEGGSLYDPNL